ncbi:MAG: glycerol-3-phosphate O-acyltransferase [Halioglobus sp.]|jgi:glycerol-3-phosphate O-acyltransferase
MTSSKPHLSVFQILRLKWYSLLRYILHIPVRSRIFSSSNEHHPVDPNVPVCYIMDSNSLPSLLVLDKACQTSELHRPLLPIPTAEQFEGRSWAALRRLSGIFVRRYSKRRSPAMLKKLVEHAQENPDFELQLVPVTILIGRAPSKEKSLAKVIFSEGWGISSRLQRFFNIVFNGRDTCVFFGSPISLRSIADEKPDEGIAVRKIYRLARTQLGRTRETAIGPDLSHRRTLTGRLMKSERVRSAIREQAEISGDSVEKLRSNAEAAANEIAANYSYAFIRFCAVVLSWFWTKIYDGVELNHFKAFEENSMGKEIVYVPCHRSHIDYLLLSYLLNLHGHVPPHIAAGVNLNLPVLGQLLRKGGAFFLRRSFRTDPLYAAVFDEYLTAILAQGVSIEYFVEGGRSRTGRLLPPRGGMVQMTVRAFLREPKKPIIFQPVYIGYEQLVEGSSYISELGGKEKKSESLKDLLGIFKTLKRNHGKVHVNFGEPIYLDDLLEIHLKPAKNDEIEDKPEWLPGLVDELTFSIMTQINGAADVNPINLLALSLLAAPKHALPRDELISQIALCLSILKSPMTPDKVTYTSLSPEQIIQYGQDLGVIEERHHSLGDIIVIHERSAVLLTYFRNNIAHLFALPSFIASSFLVRNEIPRARMVRLFALIYPYLRKELFLPWSNKESKQVFLSYIDLFISLELIEGRRTLKRAGGGTQAAASLSLLGRGLLHTFERYLITIQILVQNGSGVLSAEELEKLCILYAQRISMLHEFDAPEFYDKTLFRQFIKNLSDAGILTEDASTKLRFDNKLETISEEAKLVMSTELRHGIIQVASAAL